MKKVVLRCPPGGRFHLGKAVSDLSLQLSDTSDYIHADTLFSALVNSMAKIDPGKIELLVEAFEQGDIKISSAFYCLEPLSNQQKSDWIFFLPAPITLSNLVASDYKRAKKIKFVSEKLLNGNIDPRHWFNSEEVSLINKTFVCYTRELEFLGEKKSLLKVYERISEPKVKARTQTKEDALFERTDIQLDNHPRLHNKVRCHFWFGVETKDQNVNELLNSALRLLIEEGIGGERSIGCGALEGCDEKRPWALPEPSSAFLNLSLTIPSSNEEFKAFHSYQLIKRGGRRLAWNDNEQKYLKQVQMIKEGAVMRAPVNGKIVNLLKGGEEQPVLRYGKNFLYPISEKFLYE